MSNQRALELAVAWTELTTTTADWDAADAKLLGSLKILRAWLKYRQPGPEKNRGDERPMDNNRHHDALRSRDRAANLRVVQIAFVDVEVNQGLWRNYNI